MPSMPNAGDAWFTRPVSIHRKSRFRLALSNRCLQPILRFRMGCPNLPSDVGSRPEVPTGRSQRLCLLCHIGRPGDKIHLVLECQALQHIRDRNPGLFGQPAGTIIMWQSDLHEVAHFVTDCLNAYYTPDPERGQASD